MTQLCFGGSFNPVHVGHLLVARAVAEAKGFDGVLLIPSAQPPHKAVTADLAEPAQRLAMCQCVARCDSFFAVDDLELNRQGPSYTIDTVRELKQRGAAEVHWMIGADMLQILPRWHRPLDLLREATLWVARRPGYAIDWAALPDTFHVLKERVVTAPLVEISATDVRRRVAAGLSVRYLLPPEVEQYVRDHRLYRH